MEPPLCECGCGWPTTRIKKNHTANGHVKGDFFRFLPKHRTPPIVVEDRGYTTPCHVWIGNTEKDGYGVRKVGGKVVGAHRVAYERQYGVIPDGLVIHHICHVPPCVNPDHLSAETPGAHGFDHAAKILTESDVVDIRLSMASDRQLAEKYGVSRSTISDARKRRTWKHVL